MSENYPEFTRAEDSLDPSDELERMRNQDAIYYFKSDMLSTWMVTRYEDVRELLKDERLRTPSSEKRIVSCSEDQQAQLEGLRSALTVSALADGDSHRVVRNALKDYFTPSSINKMRPRVREVTASIFEPLDPKKPVDFVNASSYRLPAVVIAEILGVAREDAPKFMAWSKDMIKIYKQLEFSGFLEAQDSTVALTEFVTAIVNDRIENPRESADLANVFAELVKDGKATARQMASVGATLLMAGHESTAAQISKFVDAVLSDPAQKSELFADLSTLPHAIAEALRINSTSWAVRTALEDVEFGGVTFKKGQSVYLSIMSANRDEKVFPKSSDLDLKRGNARTHLAFSHGPRYCLGANLAQMEIQELANYLFGNYPGLEVVPGTREHQLLPMLRHKLTRLDVVLAPRGGN